EGAGGGGAFAPRGRGRARRGVDRLVDRDVGQPARAAAGDTGRGEGVVAGRGLREVEDSGVRVLCRVRVVLDSQVTAGGKGELRVDHDRVVVRPDVAGVAQQRVEQLELYPLCPAGDREVCELAR